MPNNLGHPNRSCVSCKERKVKCDKKIPSCAVCLKSKHRCQYTSYSPPEEPLPSVQEEETMRQQHWIQNQRMNQEAKLQPMVIRNEYDYFNENSLLGMNIENPLNLATNSQYTPKRYQPQQLAQLQQNLVQQPYILQQQCQQIPQSSPLINRNIYNSVIQSVFPGQHQRRRQKRQQRGPYATKACTNCRQKRSKCTGEVPCERCTRLNIVCAFSDLGKKRGPKKNVKPSETLSSPTGHPQQPYDIDGFTHYSDSYEEQNVPAFQEVCPVLYQASIDTGNVMPNNNLLENNNAFDNISFDDYYMLPFDH
ncbi:Ubiquinone biosynthesis O-methyltransferase [Gigaspora margarita]|uniref:Ubiquinone biosynthesis O-methyltransferase n=1 Tax=Gigaspora margarita TaxID=4874 RepID=A0A8H4AM99_GIGMA|nr:Ubiquinone biosynthesis O-methyltransferase [Gigaspora margarita]